VRQHRADIDFLAVVVDGGDQACGVAANIEDRQLSDLIGAGKERP
jgi:hypothetical protein